jgi:opacity protein-like surface antigen
VEIEEFFKNNSGGENTMTIRGLMVLVVLPLLLPASRSFAQEGAAWPHGEISVQGTGFFTKDSQTNGNSQHSTDTGGFLIGYRYHFNRWIAAEANYGYVRNLQENLTSSGPFNIQTNVHEATGEFVVTLPNTRRIYPYVLAGAGSLVFDPTGNGGRSVPGAAWQARAAFVYGGGADFAVTRHVALRAEYRGFVYDRPGFGLAALSSNVVAHTAQPSAGVVFRF